MAIDKVKPLKIENPATGGIETDMYPTEIDPLEDYAAVKGLSFEDSDDFLVDKIGRVLAESFPDLYESATYSGDTLTNITFYNSSSFIVANRIAKYDLSYTSDNLTSEILYLYDVDGTTILRTFTWTHTYSSNIFQSSQLIIT